MSGRERDLRIDIKPDGVTLINPNEIRHGLLTVSEGCRWGERRLVQVPGMPAVHITSDREHAERVIEMLVYMKSLPGGLFQG